MMKRVLLLLAALMLMTLSSGCAIYKTSVDERDVKTVATDKYITAEIKARFLEDKLVSILDIGANVYQGHAYLYGEYESDAQRARAISIAQDVDGVTNVTYYLLPKVKDDGCGTTDNLMIRGELEKELISDDRIWSTNVDVAVIQCNVLLMGRVGNQREIDLSIKYAKEIEGVRRVRSYLRVLGQ
ncbi:BON domain-containing protein [Desulfovibrio subterraneus]|jgi:hyperosmotically inducible protein|uniref:BON domain-containing protein n=1 Tax=Desulfovibrio subterraneus TaxID=2718620 RepID=A0A7J0BJK4_9BACT|nr:BON domain-containing protein [Desulfovibrio subterraneus]WBF68042.1 BON domain-containing protein [Desulfovibrio subterraneus]GFM33917.1 hypothetical protein DSM101010T_22820 [Desulfovibrio subterraneus]